MNVQNLKSGVAILFIIFLGILGAVAPAYARYTGYSSSSRTSQASTQSGVQTSMTAPSGTLAASCPFPVTKSLKKGMTSQDVFNLQKILNLSLDTEVAATGDGSPGHETTYFGTATFNAVVKFQNKYAADILIPQDLTSGNGYVGTATRLKLDAVCVSALSAGTSAGSSSPAPAPAPAPAAPPASTSKTTTSTTTAKTTTPPPAPAASPVTTITNGGKMQWGAYMGGDTSDVPNFEGTVGKTSNLVAIFWDFDASFPSEYSSIVGQKGKTLVIYWEPSYGYDTINNGSKDSAIKQFAAGAKAYGYSVILAPFDEMNINEEDWGYQQNGNTAAKFKTAWQHIHDLFAAAGATNVKFAITYNNVSVPNTSDNSFDAYYPGSQYVDYIGIDGFNFGNPWQSFGQIFDGAVKTLSAYGKPIYILSTATAEGPQKAAWIADMGTHIKTYSNVLGWVWFNENKEQNWLINSDSAALSAFKALMP